MLHGALFLTDTNEEDSEIDGHSDTEGNPSIAKEGDTDKLQNDVKEIIGMAPEAPGGGEAARSPQAGA